MFNIELQFNKEPRFTQCIFCLKWKDSCELFRLIENTHLPPAYRTLYTYKCAVCPDCRNKDVNVDILQYMKEYIGHDAQIMCSQNTEVK